MCTAPVMTRRGDGTCTVRKTLPCGVSAGPLLPERSRAASSSLSGSLATSAALTRRCSPVASLVTTITARRAARSALRPLRMSSFIGPSIHLLHVNADRAAARQADLPGRLVGDAELQRLRLAALDHVDRLGDHRAFDAAARYAPQELALVVDHQVRADRARRRAPGLHYGRERDPAALLAPVLGRLQDVFIARQHGHLR